MKKVISLGFLAIGIVVAQVPPSFGPMYRYIGTQSTLPTLCNNGDIFYNNSTYVSYSCGPINTWVQQAPPTIVVVASGSTALATASITSATCATVVTATATGALTTDALVVSFSSDPSGVTGYAPNTGGNLYIVPFPSAGAINFKVCNSTSGSITPGAITLNWKVVR